MVFVSKILYRLGSICKLQLEISNLGHSLREWELHQFQDLWKVTIGDVTALKRCIGLSLWMSNVAVGISHPFCPTCSGVLGQAWCCSTWDICRPPVLVSVEGFLCIPWWRFLLARPPSRKHVHKVDDLSYMCSSLITIMVILLNVCYINQNFIKLKSIKCQHDIEN